MIELQYYLSNLPDCLIYGLLALFAGLFAGAFAGLITGFLQTKLSVHPVLAGIITMSGLYSINLICYSFTDKGATTNLSYNKITVFEKAKQWLGLRGQLETSTVKTVVSLGIVLLVFILVLMFFKTHMGLCIRATGDNPDMVRASSINVDRMKIVGLALANALIGLSGALSTQSLGYSELNSANGTLIYGLAAVIIGEAVFGKRGVTIGLLSAIIGSVIYKLIVAFVIRENLFGDLSTNLMKFTCALIVAVTLAIPAIKKMIRERKKVRGSC